MYLLINLVYYFYFQGYIHFSQYFELWRETLELIQRSAVPFDLRVLILFMDLPLVILLLIYYKPILGLKKNHLHRYIMYGSSVGLIWYFFQWDWARDGTPIEIMNDRYASEIAAIKKYGLFTVDIANALNFKKDRALAKQFNYGSEIKRDLIEIDSSAIVNNIVVIQIESMDAFVLNKYHNKNWVAPNLHALARKNIYYPYVLSYHKAGSTSDCEFSVLNSVEALNKFPSIKLRNYNFPNAIPRKFTHNNYDVAIFHGNRGEYFNRRSAFKKMGFPYFYDMFDMGLRDVVWGAPDGDVLKFAKKKIGKIDKPFFSYVITMSSHEPFIFTKSYYNTTQFNSIKDPTVKSYFTSISYVDSVVSHFVKEVREKHPNTYFYIYGDHTPPIKDKPYTQSAFKEQGLFFEFVPLIIITPDNRKHFERKKAASFLDIAPTMLHATNKPFALRTLGENLFEPDSLYKKIPYRGIDFTREELFTKINNLYMETYKTKLK
jgi:phosphoglycerol transferase MdoB-like AlkP superfamily enzyme